MSDDPRDSHGEVREPASVPTRANGPVARLGRAADGTPTVEGHDVPDQVVGDMVGGYRIVRPIASGGFGTVYEAEHARLQRPVAIKVLHAAGAASREVVARFEREARLVNLIRHPNVVDIYDFGELDDGRPYFVMELLHGDDLRTVLARDGVMTLATALELLAPLADALDAAHAKGVVHRDLKASNVFVTDIGSPRRVVLLDFGVAKLLGDTGPSLTRSRQAVGTPTSMAPEQVRGETVDARTDVYALGSLAYAMLTGRQPFAADTAVMVQYMHLFADPPRPSLVAAVDPRIDDVVTRAMAKDPAHRPASAGAFVSDLRAACGPATTMSSADLQIVAVVMVHVPPADLADPDDALLAQLDLILCEGAAVLTAAGFTTVIEGVDRIVLRRGLAPACDARAAVGDAETRLAALPGATSPWSIAVDVGVVGGPDDPLDLGRWLSAQTPTGVYATAAATAAIWR